MQGTGTRSSKAAQNAKIALPEPDAPMSNNPPRKRQRCTPSPRDQDHELRARQSCLALTRGSALEQTVQHERSS